MKCSILCSKIIWLKKIVLNNVKRREREARKGGEMQVIMFKICQTLCSKKICSKNTFNVESLIKRGRNEVDMFDFMFDNMSDIMFDNNLFKK